MLGIYRRIARSTSDRITPRQGESKNGLSETEKKAST
jgi:hypothetical protein